MRFLKEGDKTAVKAIDSSVKNRCSWKWPDEILEHSFGNFGPIKYKIGECILKIDVESALKKLTFLGLHGVCGVKTKSAMQIMARNI